MVLYDEASMCNGISIDEDWNDSKEKEKTMHTVHTCPAKFPAFIASKAFEYDKNEGVKIKNDIAVYSC